MPTKIHTRFSLFLLLFCAIHSGHAQALYDSTVIQRIEIQFAQSNWDYMLDTAKAGEEGYVMAAYVKINGIQFDSAGVKYKGNSSYNKSRVKNPLHIELDTYKPKQNYQGYADIKLSNGMYDPSMIREVMSFDILEQYMHAPKTNFAHVFINGNFIGLYANTEAVNKKFIGERFGSSSETLIKCNPDNPSNTNTSNLVSKGTDSSAYTKYYELKSDYGWSDLIDLCSALGATGSVIGSKISVDEAAWMLAFNNLFVNLDSYSGSFSQNYYLYKDQGIFHPLIWDLNMNFGAFNMTGSGTPLSAAQMKQLSVNLHAANANRPLIKRLLSDSTFKHMYIAHMRTMLHENISNGKYLQWAQYYRSLIDSSVNADLNKLFTYTQFQNSLTTTVNSGMTIPGIQDLMSNRATYLESTPEFLAIPPTIQTINHLPLNPAFNSTFTITATIQSANYVQLGYRYASTDTFTHIRMYDDGLHNDGAANDSVYGASLTAGSSVIQYYIYSQNQYAGVFSPERAQHEFHTVQVNVPVIAKGAIVINELMAANTFYSQSPEGNYEDWIELHNTGNQPVLLDGLYLTDNYQMETKWRFPSGTVVPANGYLIVWADEQTGNGAVHSNFKLSANGEVLMLSYGNGTVIDSLTFTSQAANLSTGRYPNGTGPFVTNLPPTINAFNAYFTTVKEVFSMPPVNVYPNPAKGNITVETIAGIETVEVFDQSGRTVLSVSGENQSTLSIPVTMLANGVYFLKVNSMPSGKLVIIN
ncbi:MAG: CotH kinase family protein [Bacteroidia bacterium]|nr:CotH kinase family protein [Bacteroidia bacterium]